MNKLTRRTAMKSLTAVSTEAARAAGSFLSLSGGVPPIKVVGTMSTATCGSRPDIGSGNNP
jgi:hypothetical protein